MLHIGLVVAGAYFIFLSLWWMIQITIRYYHCRKRHVDFRSSITFPCCQSCKTRAVDGIVKIVISGIFAFVEFSFDKGYYTENVFLSRMELGTVFICLMFSGVMDVLSQWGAKSFYKQIDYAGLVLFFSAQAVIFGSHAYIGIQPVTIIHTLSLYTAIAALLSTILEAVKSEQVLCPLTRSYLLLTQGTWFLHVSLLTQSNLQTGSVADSESALLLTLFFTWHSAVNFLITSCMWLLVGKMTEKNCCTCFENEGSEPSDVIFLENRVRFDYNLLDHINSDND